MKTIPTQTFDNGMTFAWLVTLAFGIGRFLIEPRFDLPTATGSYEAFVHLWVGGLIGYWWATRRGHGSLYLYLAIFITLLEVVMFVVQKKGWLVDG